MNASATETSSAYELTWSLSFTPQGDGESGSDLKLDYQVKAFEELYVADRLWDDDPIKYRIPDPFGVYRFVQNGSLRLVFAQAPYPANYLPQKIYEPLYSRILAGETRRQSVRIKLPVDEYSSLDRGVNAPTVVEEVSRVFFVLGYDLRSTMDAAPELPPRETEEEAGYIVYSRKLIISELQVEPIPVKRRTGYMARFALPGEPAPGPFLPKESPR